MTSEPQPNGESLPQPRSLRELIDRVTGRHLTRGVPQEDAGIADQQPFPFLAIVGQPEMKLALALSVINPMVGGVLLVGPRGTGKTTAVRSLADLLPNIPRSLCYYGCLEEDIDQGGPEAVCPDCAEKFGRGEPLSAHDRVRLFELPLNAQLDDVVGKVDERNPHELYRIRRGLLSQADRNLLYIDEVNLLSNEIIDAILDAAAQGLYAVRRGPISATYRSRFVLIGSMNPEEGNLRSQILDRFGLRLVVKGLTERDERLEAYRRVQAYRTNPRMLWADYAFDTQVVQDEIQAARDRLPSVTLPNEVAHAGLQLVEHLGIDSLRAEITMFEAARAYTSADGREEVTIADLRAVAPMALRFRRSNFLKQYFTEQQDEEREIQGIIEQELT
jgi:magnesium chelatase subunit I